MLTRILDTEWCTNYNYWYCSSSTYRTRCFIDTAPGVPNVPSALLILLQQYLPYQVLYWYRSSSTYCTRYLIDTAPAVPTVPGTWSILLQQYLLYQVLDWYCSSSPAVPTIPGAMPLCLSVVFIIQVHHSYLDFLLIDSFKFEMWLYEDRECIVSNFVGCLISTSNCVVTLLKYYNVLETVIPSESMLC